MTHFTQIAELCNLCGWCLVGLGLLIVLYARFADRAHGRKRCPRCFYSLQEVAPDAAGRHTCPECGRIARARELYRARPRRSMIWFGACIALLSNALFSIPRVIAAGWIGLLPTTLLAPTAPWTAQTPVGWPKALASELDRRHRADEIHLPAAWLWVLSTRVWDALADDTTRALCTVDAGAIAARSHASSLPSLSTNEVLTVITGAINPEGWFANGGNQADSCARGRIIIFRAPPPICDAIRRLSLALASTQSSGNCIPVGAAHDQMRIVSTLRSTTFPAIPQPCRLDDIAKAITSAAGVPVRIETQEIEEAPVFVNTPITLPTSPLTCDQALSSAITALWGGNSFRVSWIIRDNTVAVTLAGPGAVLAIYDIRAVMDANPTLTWPGAISQNCDPDRWVENGGDQAAMWPIGTRLAISGDAHIHALVQSYLAGLSAPSRKSK